MDKEISPMKYWSQFHEKYFCDIEDCSKDNPTDVLFFHLPRFSRNNGFWFLAIIAVGMMAASCYLCLSCKDVAGSGGWMSNLLLNLAMGVIAGFIVFVYTTRRDRVMMGFSEVAAIMKRRLNFFRVLVGDGGALSKIEPFFLFQTRPDDPLSGIDGLYANNGFNSVLANYFKYLQKYLEPVFDGYNFAEIVAEVDRRNSEEFKNINALHAGFKGHGKLDEELKNECCRRVRETTRYIISCLDGLYYQLQTSVYGVKFGRARYLSWKEMRHSMAGRGGVINNEILQDGMRHGVFAAKGVKDGR